MRRHRRHQVRVGASMLAVAVAAALAVPPVVGALRTGSTTGGPPTSHGSKRPGGREPHADAAAGTVLSGCAGSNIGGIGRHWRSGARHLAGPLWFIDAGHSAVRGPRSKRSAAPPSSGRSGGRIRLYVAVVVLDGMRPGSAVVVKAAPEARRHLRFLYGPKDNLTPGRRYTMRSGEGGVTFESCRPDQQIVPFPGVTDYYGGYLVRGKRCVPVKVSAPGLKRSVTIRLGACPGR
jgi:hypothetical protein